MHADINIFLFFKFQWSAIQDNKFRGYVAQAIAEYCQASVSQTQECELPAYVLRFFIII